MPTARRQVTVVIDDRHSAMVIAVSDRGEGLPDAVRSIFHGGVSTKDGHQGIGLSLVRNTVTAGMGTIDATSGDGVTTIRVDGFSVVGVAGTGAQAEQLIRTLKPDLLLLDLGLPDENGIGLPRRLRARGDLIEAIVVTAATAAPVVRATVHLGIVDYLVKPFDQERVRKALALFRRRMLMLTTDKLTQPDVDRICSDGPNSYCWLPRDLSIERLRQIRQLMIELPTPATAAEIAQHTGVARVTARRYLEYLVTVGQATASTLPPGPGRPTKTSAAAAPDPKSPRLTGTAAHDR